MRKAEVPGTLLLRGDMEEVYKCYARGRGGRVDKETFFLFLPRGLNSRAATEADGQEVQDRQKEILL